MLKGIGECRRQSQLPLRKHPCFWLPWWQDLLCNHVAVARASMVMQAWPHPPAGHVSESRRLCQTDSPVSCVYKQTHSQQSFVMSLWRFVFIIDFADDTKKFSKKSIFFYMYVCWELNPRLWGCTAPFSVSWANNP